MKWLKLLLVTLIIWLLSQMITWGFAENVLKDSGIEHALGLEEVDIYLQILVYTLFPLPLALTLARRTVNGLSSEE